MIHSLSGNEMPIPRVMTPQVRKSKESQVPESALVLSPDQQREVMKSLAASAMVLGMSVPTDQAAACGTATDLTPGKGHAISTR